MWYRSRMIRARYACLRAESMVSGTHSQYRMLLILSLVITNHRRMELDNRCIAWLPSVSLERRLLRTYILLVFYTCWILLSTNFMARNRRFELTNDKHMLSPCRFLCVLQSKYMPRTTKAFIMCSQNGCPKTNKTNENGKKIKTIRKTSERAHMSCRIFVFTFAFLECVCGERERERNFSKHKSSSTSLCLRIRSFGRLLRSVVSCRGASDSSKNYETISGKHLTNYGTILRHYFRNESQMVFSQGNSPPPKLKRQISISHIAHLKQIHTTNELYHCTVRPCIYIRVVLCRDPTEHFFLSCFFCFFYCFWIGFKQRSFDFIHATFIQCDEIKWWDPYSLNLLMRKHYLQLLERKSHHILPLPKRHCTSKIIRNVIGFVLLFALNSSIQTYVKGTRKKRNKQTKCWKRTRNQKEITYFSSDLSRI